MQNTSRQLLHQFKGFLNTPALWTSRSFFEFPQLELPLVDIENLDEINIEVPKRLILGKRAELFFRYFMENFSEETILASNVQIRWEKQTIGELDFLLKNKLTKSISHVEVIYKFYLYDPSLKLEVERWIGPNRKDSLVKKLSKLKSQQFPLLYKLETKPYLEELDLSSKEIVQKVCFKANLFLPFHLKGKDLPDINNSAISGFWIKNSEFTQERFGTYKFFTPKKPDWPIDPQNNSWWYNFTEIGKQLASLLEQKKSPLIWMKKSDSEFLRFFIVWW